MELPKYKIALIVGAGEGLSASLARLFARQGVRVALAVLIVIAIGRQLLQTMQLPAFHPDALRAEEPTTAQLEPRLKPTI